MSSRAVGASLPHWPGDSADTRWLRGCEDREGGRTEKGRSGRGTSNLLRSGVFACGKCYPETRTAPRKPAFHPRSRYLARTRSAQHGAEPVEKRARAGHCLHKK